MVLPGCVGRLGNVCKNHLHKHSQGEVHQYTSTHQYRRIWSTCSWRLAPSMSFMECEMCLSHLSQLNFIGLDTTWHLWLLEEQKGGDDINCSLPLAVHRGPSDAVDSVMELSTRPVWW